MTSTANARALSSRSVSSGTGRVWAAAGDLSRSIERAWRCYWDYQARRATMMLLHSLDDRTLSDIGFQRSEIHSVVFGSPDRVRPYHPDWMWGSAQRAQA
jgi:uncharacterized protein YjiS (DUF1127 family)